MAQIERAIVYSDKIIRCRYIDDQVKSIEDNMDIKQFI